ncbi:multiubiquitin domain-containing protein [Acinetobacter baumannii]|uniref:E2/UBC family protein n=1 Tax=Acinetobacter baumannii TaxID=470 RepID=UPI0006683926|nr:E2/UBC family protein [Acinetobacter baumannii]HCA5049877.1 multiubiquitin domain-containing protein [Acinetobacter baumannii]
MQQFSYSLSDLSFKNGTIDDRSPIGSQLLRSIGYSQKDDVLLYQVLKQQGMEEISLEENIDFEKGDKFFIVEGDRSLKFKVNGFNYEWPESQITLKHLHFLTGITDKSFFLSRQTEEDLLITDDSVVNLDASGIEDIYTKVVKQYFELNVNGTKIKVDKAQIVVSEALALVGIQDGHNYQMFLKVQGEPKVEVQSNTIIDLSKPGIEKLRLIPREVNNGDISLGQFEVLQKDSEYLKQVFGDFRTIIDQGRRWLIVENYELPEGYSHKQITLALEIPSLYPQAEIDMFYTCPRIYLPNGVTPSCTEVDQIIEGKIYQRWSRHRSQVSQWNPAIDSVVTHFSLIEESLLREVQQ